jgi:hypothetical protein
MFIKSPASASRSISFVQELRAWTEQRYGRQKGLADAIGVNKSVISNWFAERQFPTAIRSGCSGVSDNLLVREYLIFNFYGRKIRSAGFQS